jgi:hypothetical protein
LRKSTTAARELRVPGDLRRAQPRLEEAAGRQLVDEPGVGSQGAEVESLLSGDLNAVDDDVDDPGELRDREVRVHRLLERLDELLLAGDAMEVGVRVAIAGEVERGAAAELLVPGLQVDPGVLAAGRVVVALIDVDVDPADLGHDLLEAVEVDGDDVIDRQPGERPDGLGRAARAAERERRVDPVAPRRRMGAATRMIDDEVSREREERDRVLVRVGADKHHGVGAADVGLRSLAGVVADDQGVRGLAGLGGNEGDAFLLDLILDVLRVIDDRGHALLEVEPHAAAERSGRDQAHHQEPQHDLAGEPQPAPPSMAVPAHRPERCTRRPCVAGSGLVGRPPVAQTAACASLQGRSHEFLRRRRPRRGVLRQAAVEDTELFGA